jgi:hypothetical protein
MSRLEADHGLGAAGIDDRTVKPGALETCKPEKPSNAALLNRTSAQRIPSKPSLAKPECADAQCCNQTSQAPYSRPAIAMRDSRVERRHTP